DSAERLQGGRLLSRPQQDYPAATVVEYCSAVLTLPLAGFPRLSMQQRQTAWPFARSWKRRTSR
ncbi:hypothetical protein, partial [Novosphingobium lindaniclasticum]|uniref:hypothetical protein n=1 Tax=Novosphingobium lindaniclasticum TaxID=1329895 RepID=UPI002409AA65